MSGKRYTTQTTYSNFLIYCENNGKPDGNGGSGYDMLGFYPITLLQAMYLLKYKSLNSQTALGLGNVGASSITTGTTNTNGMCYGSTSSSDSMKIYGIENCWGLARQYIGGLYINSSSHILTATENFNTTGSGYTDNGLHDSGSTGYYAGYITKVMGTTQLGFYPKAVSGSSTTYYCDEGWSEANKVGYFGGQWANNVDTSGIFFLVTHDGVSSTPNTVATRLMYL